MYILYVINIDENAISETEAIIRQYDFLKSDNSAVTALYATIEEEIAELGSEDQAEFLSDLEIRFNV